MGGKGSLSLSASPAPTCSPLPSPFLPPFLLHSGIEKWVWVLVIGTQEWSNRASCSVTPGLLFSPSLTFRCSPSHTHPICCCSVITETRALCLSSLLSFQSPHLHSAWCLSNLSCHTELLKPGSQFTVSPDAFSSSFSCISSLVPCDFISPRFLYPLCLKFIILYSLCHSFILNDLMNLLLSFWIHGPYAYPMLYIPQDSGKGDFEYRTCSC